MNNITIVWNRHGAGKLIGVYDDAEKLKEIREEVKKMKEQAYIVFIDVEMNKTYLEVKD